MTEAHWDRAYAARGPQGVSWYEPSAGLSLELVSTLGVAPDAAVLDVGGGASTLAAELVARGFHDVSVLDLSAVALEAARAATAAPVEWIHADVRSWEPERAYGLWHDRAVLHFFTEEEQRQAYLRTLRAGTGPGSFVVLATFAPDGPDRCSGLPVRRYGADELARLLGPEFEPLAAVRAEHRTPRGALQPFTWAAFERR